MFGISLARISLLTGTSLGGGVGVSPTLDLNFRGQGYSAAMAGYTFNQLIDFTRTSAATYVDASGRIVPTPASRNLLTYTQEFDNAAWSKLNGTVTANTTVAPDGTLTADTFSDGVTANPHGVKLTSNPALSTTYALSVYAKMGTRRYVTLSLSAASSSTLYAAVSFDLQSGVVGTASAVGTGYAVVSSSIQNAGNGWYRCVAVLTVGSVGTALQGYISTGTDGTIGGFGLQTYTGTDGSVHLWGAQLEAASTATDYTRNNGGVYPPRFDYDPVTLAPKGLLIEEQRTNLLTYSEQFDNAAWNKSNATIAANSTTAPDGTTGADTVTATGAGGWAARLSLTGAVSTTYTVSVFAKAGTGNFVRIYIGGGGVGGADGGCSINLTTGALTSSGAATVATAQQISNGWWRLAVTFTTSNADNIFDILLQVGNDAAMTTTGSAYLWGAQLEAGAFATSYIPTVASQVTRTADVATITGANFSQWYNQSEGTVVSEFSSYVPTSNSQIAWTISDGTNNERWFAFCVNNAIRHFMVDGGATQASIDVGTYAANTVFKSAMAIRLNSVQAAVNGALGVEDTSATTPSVDRLGLGTAPSASTGFLNGHIRSLRFFPTRLSNAQLQALTA